MKPDRPKLTQVEVLAWLLENDPELHAAAEIEIDRNWVWLTIDLRGCGRKKCECERCASQHKRREGVKSIGFRFKFDGDHTLPSGKTSRWGHNCGHAIPNRRNKPAGGKPGSGPEQQPDLTDEQIIVMVLG